MPIVVKNIEWHQTQSTVTVKVPLKVCNPAKADIFYSKGYIKASFERTFFEAILLHPIDPAESCCTIRVDDLIFELRKEEEMHWESLERAVNKSEKMALKTLYIEEEHQRIQKEDQERRDKKHELKRVAVREQISLDSAHREHIENIKKEEKEKALSEMNVWRGQIEDDHLQGINTGKQTCDEMEQQDNVVGNCDTPISEIKAEKNAKKQGITKSRTIKHKNQQKDRKNDNTHITPQMRTSRVLYVDFTPREFPTPCRESRLEEENEWLRKRSEAMRTAGFISEDIRPEERNPQFLKAKGDEFLRNSNYLGAISAYSFGIKLSDKVADLYLARSEAHIALGNYMKATQDCSKALELMKPEVPQNLQERALCIGRRGLSLVELGLINQGIGELRASLKLQENDEFETALQNAFEKLKETENSNN